jgi:hypothetical protein
MSERRVQHDFTSRGREGLTKLAERPPLAFWEPEEHPQGHEKSAACREEARVSSPVPSCGVELVTQEDTDRDTELQVRSLAHA